MRHRSPTGPACPPARPDHAQIASGHRDPRLAVARPQRQQRRRTAGVLADQHRPVGGKSGFDGGSDRREGDAPVGHVIGVAVSGEADVVVAHAHRQRIVDAAPVIGVLPACPLARLPSVPTGPAT
jgi:hypothetical protein